MMEKLLIFHGSRTLHTYDPETEDEVDNFDDKNDLELAQAAEADLHEPEGEWNKVFKATRRVREEADMISELLDCSAAYERQEAEKKVAKTTTGLEAQIEAAKTRYRSSEERRTQAEANATKAISQLRESLEALRVENGNLLSQLHKCKEAHAAYQVQESQIARMQEQLQQESETNRKRTATIERLQKQIDAHKASASKTERKQEHHDVEQTKTDALQEQSKIAQTLIDELREKQRLHKEMTDKLQNSQEATIHELRKWCNGYEPIVARLQKQCEAYEARIPELQKKCEAHQSCSTMIEALRRECQEHLREAGDLRAQLSKPNLHRRCTENLASLKKQLASRQEKNQPTSRVVLREAVPNPAAIPMEDDPVRAENLLLKSTIKQVDENITSLCALMVNVMGFLKRTEERKAAYSRMGRVIMSLGRGDIIRLPANDPNAPATLASFVREFVVSYDLAYMQCMRLGDIIQAEREVIRQASGAMKELQADHDELQGTCIAVLEKATRERTQAKARETKLLDDIRQSEELIFGYEEVIRRLMHQS